MIRSIKLTNFKAFKNTTAEIELSPLTVIVGPNSCGKSSILQSLLLLKQTINSSNKAALELDGQYLRHSSLSELSNGLPTSASAKLGIELVNEAYIGPNRTISLHFKTKKDENSYHPAVDRITTKYGKNKIDYSTLTIDTLRALLKKRKESYVDQMLEKFKSPKLRVIYDKFLPESIELFDDNGENVKHGHTFRIPCDYLIEDAPVFSGLKNSLENIRYLNPVRAMPQRAYIHYTNEILDLREDGANSAHVMWANRAKQVKWRGSKIQLSIAINECIACMGLGQKVKPTQTGKMMYQIKVGISNNSKDVTIADVGFGYSQVIPIILMGLLNNAHNLMLIEQPEIHLHPSSSANLADLFLGFVQDGKRFVIETHSHDLINRLRLRVIENPKLKDMINIVFVSQTPDGKAHIKQFRIDENGAFPEWPAGFLDHSESAARALIMARANQLKKSPRNSPDAGSK